MGRFHCVSANVCAGMPGSPPKSRFGGRAQILVNSPYALSPKGVRTFKSHIAEERDYARLLSAAIGSAQDGSLSSAVWRPDRVPRKRRPRSAETRGLDPAPAEHLKRSVDTSAASSQPTPPATAAPSTLSDARAATPQYGEGRAGGQEESTRRARERAREKRFERTFSENALLVEEVKKNERKAEWANKQLARCSQQLAQMRALLVSVSEQRDAAQAAAKIASEEAQVAATEVTALRGENLQLRTEVAELRGIPPELRPMMASLVLDKTPAPARLNGSSCRGTAPAAPVVVAPVPGKDALGGDALGDEVPEAWRELFTEDAAARPTAEALTEAAEMLAQQDGTSALQLLRADADFREDHRQRKNQASAAFRLQVRSMRWLRNIRQRKSVQGGAAEAASEASEAAKFLAAPVASDAPAPPEAQPASGSAEPDALPKPPVAAAAPTAASEPESYVAKFIAAPVGSDVSAFLAAQAAPGLPEPGAAVAAAAAAAAAEGEGEGAPNTHPLLPTCDGDALGSAALGSAALGSAALGFELEAELDDTLRQQARNESVATAGERVATEVATEVSAELAGDGAPLSPAVMEPSGMGSPLGSPEGNSPVRGGRLSAPSILKPKAVPTGSSLPPPNPAYKSITSKKKNVADPFSKR